MLLYFSHMSGGQYLLGDYDTDRDKFIVTHGAKFNFGPYGPSGVHAPSAAPDGKGGLVVIFNMNPGKPTAGWNQIMTLPRRLTVEGDEVLMEPTGDIESLRGDHVHIGPTAMPANEEQVLDTVRGNAVEIAAEIDPGDAPMVELNVLRSPDRQEYTRIAFYRARGNRARVNGTAATSSLLPLAPSSLLLLFFFFFFFIVRVFLFFSVCECVCELVFELVSE